MCFTFSVVLETEVTNQQPALAKVFDYYESSELPKCLLSQPVPPPILIYHSFHGEAGTFHLDHLAPNQSYLSLSKFENWITTHNFMCQI